MTKLTDIGLAKSYGLLESDLLTPPLWEAFVKHGMGVVVEEGTTNLVLDPSFSAPSSASAVLWSAYLGGTPYRFDTAGEAGGYSWYGNLSLRITPDPTTPIGSGAQSPEIAVVSGNTYTAQLRVRPNIAKTNWRVNFTNLGNVVELVDLNPDVWTEVVVTAVASGATVRARAQARESVPGQLLYVDGFQLEEKAYATSYADGGILTGDGLASGYRWTGVEHQSTSQRDPGRLSFPIALAPQGVTSGGDFSGRIIFRPNWPGDRSPVSTRAFLSLYGADGAWAYRLVSATANRISLQSAQAMGTVSADFPWAAGDLISAAFRVKQNGDVRLAVVGPDGTIYRSSYTHSGAALTSALLLNRVYIGSQGTTLQANAALEGLVLMSEAVSDSELDQMALAERPLRYEDDRRIHLAWGEASTRGSKTQAASSLGTGLFRVTPAKAYLRFADGKRFASVIGSGVGASDYVVVGGQAHDIRRIIVVSEHSDTIQY